MNLLTENIKRIYKKYLTAAFGSALVSSIYGLVDMAVVGQYHGPSGSAAMAVVAPIWNIIYSCGLLTGIGGSVLFSNIRGKAANLKDDQEYFTSAVLLTAILSAALWVALIVWEEPLLRLFGADDALMILSKRYLFPVKFAVPVFLFTQLLAAFLRNDSDPGLATKSVLYGGIFNLAGDYLLVFVFDLGIMGAGIATVGSATISLIIMSTHFLKKSNTLRWVMPKHFFAKAKRIIAVGFSTFFIDLAMGLLTMLFNRQIMRYAGTDALAVYGIIVNVSTFVQCCAYGIGQASQPILSTNFGARKWDRVRTLVRYNLITVAAVSAVWVALIMSVPNAFVRLFMDPTDSVLSIAPAILRVYGLSFLFLPLNIYSTYYFQSVMQSGVSFAVSVTRGMLLSGILIITLPILFGGAMLWWAMPITELVVAGFVIIYMSKTLRGNDIANRPDTASQNR